MTYIATKLDYIQSLIDEGNTVVVQNQRYNWAGPVHRVITEKDKDMGEGFLSLSGGIKLLGSLARLDHTVKNQLINCIS